MEKLKSALALAKSRRSVQDLHDLIDAVEEFLETESCAGGCKLFEEVDLSVSAPDENPGEPLGGQPQAEAPPAAEQGANVTPEGT